MSTIKLIASDLDGTLLDSTGKLPERNIRAVKSAIAKGIVFAICTGRMYSSAMRFAEQIGEKMPLICYNGAMLLDTDGRELQHIRLGVAIARELLAIFKERGTYVQMYLDDKLYIKTTDADEFQMYMKHFGMSGAAIGDELYSPVSEPTKLLVMTKDGEEAKSLMRELQDRFGEKLYVTRSNSDFVEMMNPNVNKWNALLKLAEHMGFTADEVMAMGDGDNDVEMVANSGMGIAMSNGGERIKKAAKYIAPSNDDGGAGWAIEKSF
ncbi:haloacid dehalogenase [Synergistales bacterium]|nr:haloacid dehalogenase [Synergistales bacterium]